MHRVILLALASGACIQPPPRATVVVNTPEPISAAVLVLPTTCSVRDGWATLCDPTSWGQKAAMQDNAQTWGHYIDPPLRLKLELAGFTLAEAAALRLVTADRVETNGTSQIEEPAGARTVADLSFDDARAVARSLGIRNILVPTLVFTAAKYSTYDGELSIALVDIDTGNELWNVRCRENFLSVDENANRIANCVGNGVLAVLAPENVIGKAL